MSNQSFATQSGSPTILPPQLRGKNAGTRTTTIGIPFELYPVAAKPYCLPCSSGFAGLIETTSKACDFISGVRGVGAEFTCAKSAADVTTVNGATKRKTLRGRLVLIHDTVPLPLW